MSLVLSHTWRVPQCRCSSILLSSPLLVSKSWMKGEGQMGISSKSAPFGWKSAWAPSPVSRWLCFRLQRCSGGKLSCRVLMGCTNLWFCTILAPRKLASMREKDISELSAVICCSARFILLFQCFLKLQGKLFYIATHSPLKMWLAH